MLSANRITVSYGNLPVLRDLSVTIPEGGITALVGPNGSGKSTLLKALAGLLEPEAGVVRFAGQSLDLWNRHQLAQQLAMLPQKPIVPEGILVADLVALGRFPHRKWWQRDGRQDRDAVTEAMALTGVGHLAARPVSKLSGGQQQRVWIAMALAQQSSMLLLDEPTTFLDWGYQLEVMEILAGLNRTRGLTVVMSLHDLNQAAQFADRILVLESGQLRAEGTPREVITPQLLADTFRVRGQVRLGDDERPFCIGHGTAATTA